MIKRAHLVLILATLSLTQRVSSAPAQAGGNLPPRTTSRSKDLSLLMPALSFCSGIQPSQVTKKNVSTIFAPIAALHALEHFGCGNNAFGRWITGDTNNPNQKTSTALFLATKLAYHLIPSVLQNSAIFLGTKRGITSFVNGGHLAACLFTMSGIAHSLQTKMLLKATSLLLVLNQLKTVRSVHRDVARECREKEVPLPQVSLITEPSPQHVKMPRYLTQNLDMIIKHIIAAGYKHEEYTAHFNKEFYTHHHLTGGEPRLVRALHDPLVGNGCTSLSEVKSAALTLGAVIISGAITKAIQIFLGTFIPEDSCLSLIATANKFLTPETFSALSPELQRRIIALNQQELIFNAYNLTNPLTEHAFALAHYSTTTEYEDPDFTPENIHYDVSRKRQEYAASMQNFQIYSSLLSTLPDETAQDKEARRQAAARAASSFPLPEDDPKNNSQDFEMHCLTRLWQLKTRHPNSKPLNYQEGILAYFIPFATEARPETRRNARAIATKVLKRKPVSRLAKKVLELTTTLQPAA